MKYLLYLRPPETLQHLLYSFRQNLQNYLLDTPGAGDHCTLLAARLQEQLEEPLIGSLRSIDQGPFPLKMEKLDFFDEPGESNEPNNRNLVILFHPAEALQQLHREVSDIAKRFVYWKEVPSFSRFPFPQNPAREEAYRRYGSPYFGQFYNPHLSIGEVRPGLEELLWQPSFLRYEWPVSEFYLAKKDGKAWKEVQRFPLEGS